MQSMRAPFGSPTANSRRGEWKRLGVFLALGTAFFLLAVVGAAFVPFAWPDAIRRSGHPIFFVPLALALTIRLVRKDAGETAPADLFDPWPIGRSSIAWLILGSILAAIVALTFVLFLGLRWAPNAQWSRGGTALMLCAIVLIAAAEEIAFRGYALWRLTRLIGFWQAQAIIAVLFALSHLTLGGYTLVPALVGTITGSILYGVAFARSRGLAAPIALHSGWNIIQHLLLSPLNPTATPVVPIFPHSPTSAEYAAMLAIIAIVMTVTTVALVRTSR